MRWPTPTARRWIWVPSPLLQPPLRHLYAQRRVQVVAHTHNVRADGRATVAAAMPAPTTARCRTATLRCRSAPLCGVSYGTPLRDLRTPTGKIIIDENNWWQDFLNTVTFGLFLPHRRPVHHRGRR